MSTANAVRGEAAIRVNGEPLVLRPSFAALVAAENELGPLFALVDRAAEAQLSLAEMVALFWHCRHDAPAALTRDMLGEAVVAGGLAQATPAGLAGVAFGWSPDTFWHATPAELRALAEALGADAAATPPDAALIARLKEAYPDG